jgi:hypothetical protein
LVVVEESGGEGVWGRDKKEKKEGRGSCLGQAYRPPDGGVGCCRIEHEESPPMLGEGGAIRGGEEITRERNSVP